LGKATKIFMSLSPSMEKLGSQQMFFVIYYIGGVTKFFNQI